MAVIILINNTMLINGALKLDIVNFGNINEEQKTSVLKLR